MREILNEVQNPWRRVQGLVLKLEDRETQRQNTSTKAYRDSNQRFTQMVKAK